MAFMSAEHSREIKENLKKAYPHLTFSVRNEHYTGVRVSIIAGDIDFSGLLEGRGHVGINQYVLMREYGKPEYGEHTELLKGIFCIVNKGNHDRSDLMTDYFDVGFYVTLEIGRWDKPYKLKVLA